jgi:hypothetical protein
VNGQQVATRTGAVVHGPGSLARDLAAAVDSGTTHNFTFQGEVELIPRPSSERAELCFRLFSYLPCRFELGE